MASYKLSDIAKRGLWTQEDILLSDEMTNLFDSGMLITDPKIDSKVQNGDAGDLIEIPFIKENIYSEPNISDDSTTNAAFEGITKLKMFALLGNYNKAWGSYDIARMLDSGNDPFEVMQSLIGRYWVKDIQHRMVNIANGVLASNVANDGGDLLNDQSGQDYDANMLIDTNKLRGDKGYGGHDFMFVHSEAFASMKKADSTRIRMVLDTKTGKPLYNLYDEQSIIIIDDTMPFDGTNATCMLADRGAFVYADSGDVVEALAYVRDELTGAGGGHEGVISRKRYLLHLNGFSFTGVTMAKSTGATLAELQDATNWQRKVTKKQSPVSWLKFKV